MTKIHITKTMNILRHTQASTEIIKEAIIMTVNIPKLEATVVTLIEEHLEVATVNKPVDTKTGADTKIEEVTEIEEVTKIEEATKKEEVSKAEEDIKIEAATITVDEVVTNMTHKRTIKNLTSAISMT